MESNSNQLEPNHKGLFRVLRRNFHWKCFVLTAMIDGCLGVIFWCQLNYSSYSERSSGNSKTGGKHGPCDQGYNFIPVAFSVMLYVVYIMECWHCRTRLDLLCQADIDTVYNYVEQVREAPPMVWWRAVCYHYVRRTRQVTRYRNGDAITSTQVYYERVNSHSAGSVFLYHDCGVKDISKKLINLETSAVTKIRFSKGFVFANLQAASEFEEQRARFFQENEQRDDYMEVREGLDLSNVPFKDFMVAFANPKSRPWYTRQLTFWAISFCLCSWPLRVLVEYKTAYVHFQATKLFGTNYLSPSSQNYTGPLTRTNTMDSRDLEQAMLTNYVIVPSYSEALLMDPVSNRNNSVSTDRQGILHIQTARCRSQRGDNIRDSLYNNENVIRNYGALIHEQGEVPNFIPARRSQSMGFFGARSGSLRNTGRSRNADQSNGSIRASRSISIGSMVNMARGGYRTLPATPEERVTLLPEEPPPPYEIAMQMCAPLYDRLKRSTNSIHKFAQKYSTSRSASKDSGQNRGSESQGPPNDGDTLL